MATFGYDDLGRRIGLTRGNGTSTTYGYDSADRPTALTQDVVGTPFDQTYGFTWSPASQLLTRTASNAAYKWATPTPGTTANAYDGLNRDSAIVTAGGYDLRGNLTADGGRTFTGACPRAGPSAGPGGCGKPHADGGQWRHRGDLHLRPDRAAEHHRGPDRDDVPL